MSGNLEKVSNQIQLGSNITALCRVLYLLCGVYICIEFTGEVERMIIIYTYIYMSLYVYRVSEQIIENTTAERLEDDHVLSSNFYIKC